MRKFIKPNIKFISSIEECYIFTIEMKVLSLGFVNVCIGSFFKENLGKLFIDTNISRVGTTEVIIHLDGKKEIKHHLCKN